MFPVIAFEGLPTTVTSSICGLVVATKVVVFVGLTDFLPTTVTSTNSDFVLAGLTVDFTPVTVIGASTTSISSRSATLTSLIGSSLISARLSTSPSTFTFCKDSVGIKAELGKQYLFSNAFFSGESDKV